MYRVLDGRFFGGGKDVHVLIITTPGRRTAIPRSTCVRFLDSADGLVVWGTASGSARDPDWFRNVLVQVPGVEKYARRAGRTIPVAILEPVDGGPT